MNRRDPIEGDFNRGVQVTCTKCDEPMPFERGDSSPFICEDCRRVTPTALAHERSMFEFAKDLARKHAAEVLAR